MGQTILATCTHACHRHVQRWPVCPSHVYEVLSPNEPTMAKETTMSIVGGRRAAQRRRSLGGSRVVRLRARWEGRNGGRRCCAKSRQKRHTQPSGTNCRPHGREGYAGRRGTPACGMVIRCSVARASTLRCAAYGKFVCSVR